MTATTPPIGRLFSQPQTQPLSNDGKPMPYCYRVFYLTNSTTAAAVYTNSQLSASPTPPNVVTAGSTGQFQPIYLNPGLQYRSQLFNAAGQLLEDVDPVNQPAMGTPYIAGIVRSAIKGATTSRTSTIIRTADPDLTVTLPNAGTYKIDLDLILQAAASGSTPGITMALVQVGFDGFVNINAVLPVAGVTNGAVATQPLTVNNAGSPLSLSLGTTSISNVMRFSGTVQLLPLNPASSDLGVYGQLTLYWAQQVSSTASTSILAGSSMTVTQVA